jgi:hypothetical protein
VLRAALLLAGGGAVGVLAADGTVVPVLVALFALAAVSALAPASPAPAMLIAAVGVAVVVEGDDPLRLAVLVELPLVHLVHLTAALAALLPLRSVIQPTALLRPAVRFVVVQAVVFAVAGIAEILPTRRNATIVELAGLIAATGLVLVAIRLLTRHK